MVWIFSPPGVSSALANSIRALDSAMASRGPASSPSSFASSSWRASSSITDQPPSTSNKRRCISAAAALV